MFRGILALFLVVILVHNAAAQIRPGDKLLIGTGSYLTGKSAVTGEMVGGNAFVGGIETLGYGPLSLGFSVGYGSMTWETNKDNEVVKYTLTAWPVCLGGKYYFGDRILQPYLGAALGLFFSGLEATVVSTDQSYTRVSTEGSGLVVPVGLVLSLGGTFFLNANYTLLWLWDNDYVKDDILNSIGIGLGVKFGP